MAGSSNDDPIRQLAAAATARMDSLEERQKDLEGRQRVTELAEAERRGASSGFARVAPWLALLISAAALAANMMRFKP